MKIYRSLGLLSLTVAGPVALHAQPVNVQQFQNLQQAQQFQQPLAGSLASTNAPELYAGENTDVGPQHILRRSPRLNYFNLFFDSQVFYSDNANFAEGAAVLGSAVFVNTAQAAFTPPELKLGSGKFTPAIGIVSQWYNYENTRMHSLDFNAQTAFASGRYTINYWQFGGGVNYTRLVDQGSNDQTYDEWLPALTVQRFFPVGEKLLFAIGNQVSYHFSSVPTYVAPGITSGPSEINNRLDDAVSLTLSWQVVRQLTLQPYYRFQYSNYRYNTLQNSDRNDYLNSFGITLTYYVTPVVSLRAFFNANIKQSDDPYTPAYHEVNEGVGLSANFNF